MLPANFVTGRARFSDAGAYRRESTAKVYVPVRVGGLQILAQLDTGAPFSVLPTEICEAVGLLGRDGPLIPLSTRLGVKEGRLERVVLTFVASAGVSLDVDSTVFVSDEWDHDAFLGWGGCLERVRIALDPAQNVNHFYFGMVA